MNEFQLDADKRIFVAGHRGLIGSAFMRRFQQENYQNIITANRDQLDLTNEKQVNDFVEKGRPEIIIMTAAKVGGIVENRDYPADFIVTNLSIQLNLMRAAWTYGVKRVIFFGSSCMYPRETHQPMAESQLFTGVPESTSIAYATAKIAGLQTCLAYNQQYQASRFIPLIPNNTFGPHDNFDLASSHVLSALIRRFHEAKINNANSVTLWGTGHPRREFIHADDIVDATLFLLQKKELESVQFPINVGVGRDYSIKELAELIRHIVGFPGKIHWDTNKPDGAPRKLLDSSRLKALGWHPKIAFEEGIFNTYQWYSKSIIK